MYFHINLIKIPPIGLADEIMAAKSMFGNFSNYYNELINGQEPEMALIFASS